MESTSPERRVSYASEETTQSRHVARHVSVSELTDAVYRFTDTGDDNAPVYTLLPTGQRANRVIVSGTFLGHSFAKDTTDETPRVQVRVNDGVASVVVSAVKGFNEYAYRQLVRLSDIITHKNDSEVATVKVIGKIFTYGQDTTEIGISPEQIVTVSTQTRRDWVVSTTRETHTRIRDFYQFEKTDACDISAERQKDYHLYREQYPDIEPRDYYEPVSTLMSQLVTG